MSTIMIIICWCSLNIICTLTCPSCYCIIEDLDIYKMYIELLSGSTRDRNGERWDEIQIKIVHHLPSHRIVQKVGPSFSHFIQDLRKACKACPESEMTWTGARTALCSAEDCTDVQQNHLQHQMINKSYNHSAAHSDSDVISKNLRAI